MAIDPLLEQRLLSIEADVDELKNDLQAARLRVLAVEGDVDDIRLAAGNLAQRVRAGIKRLDAIEVFVDRALDEVIAILSQARGVNPSQVARVGQKLWQWRDLMRDARDEQT